ncbi:MAG: DUF4139 domain-containing protein [Planctomycetota bacterium]|nr:DUF4139 domain-containing protein [Planctomycetota bacterium]
MSPSRSSRLVLSACVLVALSGVAVAGPKTTVTIYSSAQPGAIPADMYRPTPQNPYAAQQQIPGSAFVRQQLSLPFARGSGNVRITDVAALIDPTTVSFESIDDPKGTRVLEQNFQFDLVSRERLMEKFIDQPVKVAVKVGDKVETKSGTLLSTIGGIMLRDADGQVTILNDYSGVQLPQLPGGLITRPTLDWRVSSEREGPQNVRIGYETQGITWWADYNVLFHPGKDANSGTLDVASWVSILNQSGATYEEATLKLIAGEVNRAPQANTPRYAGRVAELAMKSERDEGFAEKSFFEYHMYTLGRATTIPDKSTKQIEMFPTVRNVPCEKIMLYDAMAANSWWDWNTPMTDPNFGIGSPSNVAVYLRFKNTKDNGMGMPLPAGRVRLSQLDNDAKGGTGGDGNAEFIGEDVIKHTPKDEKVMLKVGNAFDVIGERKQTAFSVNANGHEITESIEITLRNHKSEPVKVIVQERMFRWSNWQFIGDAPANEKLDARTLHFPVTIAKDGEQTIKYTVRYTW